MADKILPGYDSIFKENGEKGCLLLHGFTSCPFELRLLGDHLNNAGYTVSIPLLPGHGTTPLDLKRLSWMDWHIAAKEALFELRKKCKPLYVIGLSMGGSLALHLAAHYKVDGIVALAPGLFLKNRLSYLSHFLYPFYPYSKKWLGPDIQADTETLSYGKIPVKSISQLLKMFKHLLDDLIDITAPLLIIYADQDHVINSESAHRIYRDVSSQNKRIINLKKSYHIITLDVEKEKVFRETTNFLRELE